MFLDENERNKTEEQLHKFWTDELQKHIAG